MDDRDNTGREWKMEMKMQMEILGEVSKNEYLLHNFDQVFLQSESQLCIEPLTIISFQPFIQLLH